MIHESHPAVLGCGELAATRLFARLDFKEAIAALKETSEGMKKWRAEALYYGLPGFTG